MAPRAEAPAVPETLGPYRCLRKLAVGGMGEVYLAEASGAGDFKKRLVVKAVRADRADENDVVQAFLDEARIWALLTHPNIVPLFDCVWLEGRLCLVMEYIEGADLRELIQAAQELQQPIAPAIVIHLTTQLAAGLHAAHEARGPDGVLLGVVHRDVSPHNVLIDHEGCARLCDFGIARSVLRQNRTRSGRFKGKFAYVSPEAIRGDQVDRRADVFGMGVLLYELLSLERPFQAEGPVPLLRAILESEPLSLSIRRPDLSPELRGVVERALAKQSDDRFPSADALRWALLGTPEAKSPPDLAQLNEWFELLTGVNQHEPGTQPLLLDSAARSAARSIHDDADGLEPSVGPRRPSRPLGHVARVLPPTPPLPSSEVTQPRAKPPPPLPEPPAPTPVIAFKKGAQMKSPDLPPTLDISNAKTVLKPSGKVPKGNPWPRRFQELWPWMLAGGAFGGAVIWVMTHLFRQ